MAQLNVYEVVYWIHAVRLNEAHELVDLVRNDQACRPYSHACYSIMTIQAYRKVYTNLVFEEFMSAPHEAALSVRGGCSSHTYRCVYLFLQCMPSDLLIFSVISN